MKAVVSSVRARAVQVAASVLVLASSGEAAAAEPPIFGLAIAIARDEKGERVVDDAWVERQIDDANGFFAPLGTRFRWTIEKELAEPHGELHARADRDALTPLTETNVIDVFVVRALEDVDEPGRYRMGVCWTGRGGKRFIVVARTARPTVLAHELGHFFGNRQHSTVVNNLMSYTRDGGTVFLDARQIATIQRSTRSFLETGRLVDVGPPRRVR
ncbi:MAG: hypothetical protein KF782_28710 [Labilithrix sp.]|nr:hypothetical protein [Labilithrix sp.]